MAEISEPEARVYPRKAFSCPAKLVVGEQAPLDVETIDISLGGACLLVSRQVNYGEFCVIRFNTEINGTTRAFTAVAKAVYGSAIGNGSFRIGFQFFRVDDANIAIVQALVA